MTYQYTNQSHPNPEHDPSRQVSTAHEILFSRAGELSQAKRIKAASEQAVMEALGSADLESVPQIPNEIAQKPAADAPDAVFQSDFDRDRVIRQQRDRVQDAHDGFDADGIMKYEDLAA